jgi:hypothetical protein
MPPTTGCTNLSNISPPKCSLTISAMLTSAERVLGDWVISLVTLNLEAKERRGVETRPATSDGVGSATSAPRRTR